MTIAHGRLFTLEQWRTGEAVTCYNLADGRGLWRHTYAGEFVDDLWDVSGTGPRTTPTWDGDRLYTLGAEGQLHCLAADTGKVILQKKYLRRLRHAQPILRHLRLAIGVG